MKVNKKIIVGLFLIIATMAVGFLASYALDIINPSESRSYDNKEDCETKTATSCVLERCDQSISTETMPATCAKANNQGWVVEERLY